MKESDGMIADNDYVPIRCPKCNAMINKEVVRLQVGGFIYLEKCSKMGKHHYSHYRDVTFRELQEFNS